MGFLAFAAFWVLLIAGLYQQELSYKGAALFIAVWLIGITAMAAAEVQPMFSVLLYVLLDIVLILKLFGGDIRLR